VQRARLAPDGRGRQQAKGIAAATTTTSSNAAMARHLDTGARDWT